MHDPLTRTKGGECWWQGVCRAEGDKEGEKWNNCNSIINKIYFKKCTKTEDKKLQMGNSNTKIRK